MYGHACGNAAKPLHSLKMQRGIADNLTGPNYSASVGGCSSARGKLPRKRQFEDAVRDREVYPVFRVLYGRASAKSLPQDLPGSCSCKPL
jgi:hypothetical protein